MLIMFMHNSGKLTPSAAASCGSNDTGVIPGSVFASKQYILLSDSLIKKSIRAYVFILSALYTFSAASLMSYSLTTRQDKYPLYFPADTCSYNHKILLLAQSL